MTDKITIERQTLQQLHDELETVEYDADPPKRVLVLMEALRAALAAQPAEPVEPVAWIWHQHMGEKTKSLRWTKPSQWEYVEKLEPLYAAPPAPAAVPLTDEQIKDVLLQYRCEHFQDEDGGLHLADALAHAFGDTDIARAKHEIQMIADAIAAAGDKS